MKLAFIGIGQVGGTLAKKLGKQGHSIYLGSRDLKSFDAIELAKSIGAHASVHSLSEAVQNADIIFLATPWSAAKAVVASLSQELRDKIVIDCTNPLKANFEGLDSIDGLSGAEQLQKLIPGSHVVKAFNSTGYNIMAQPMIENRKAIMYYCGDDIDSKHLVRTLVEDVGFEAADGGPLTTARLLEPFALLWISSAYKFGFGRDFAFSIIRQKN